MKSAKSGEVSGLSGARGARLARADLRLGRCIRAGHGLNLKAEADGNRTRLPAFAGTPVLKTGGPTRRPVASSGEDTECAGQRRCRNQSAGSNRSNRTGHGKRLLRGGGRGAVRRRRAESGFLRQPQ